MFWQPLCCRKCLDFMLNSVLSNLSLRKAAFSENVHFFAAAFIFFFLKSVMVIVAKKNPSQLSPPTKKKVNLNDVIYDFLNRQ